MKKMIRVGFICMILIAGCAQKKNENSFNQMNVDEIKQGNFSSIAGTYINSDGETIQLDEDGLSWYERQQGEVRCADNNFCTMNIFEKGEAVGGYGLSIFPPGMEIDGLSTDVSKVRIYYGQDWPMSENEIYMYDSNQLEPVVIESAFQAFIMKDYFDVLDEASRPYYLFNPQFDKHISFFGLDILIDYYYEDRLYNLYLEKDIEYVKNNEIKTAHLVAASACYEDQKIIYDGRLIISDGQEFLIGYDELNQQITNHKEGSETFGQPLEFVNSLNSQIISVFEDAKRITALHYPVFYEWQNELSKVKNNTITYDEMKSAKEIEVQNNTSIQEDKLQLLRKAFNEKHYFDVLSQCFRQHYIKDVTVYHDLIVLNGYEQTIYYQENDVYSLQMDCYISYQKNGIEKYGTLYLVASCDDKLRTEYSGRFELSDGQTFHVLYDPENEVILDHEKESETFGQPTKFVDSLNTRLVAAFKEAQTITELQYPVFHTWMQEMKSVNSSEKTMDEIKDANDIKLNLEVLDIEFDVSMSDFIMTDPCASAMEIVKCQMYQARKASSISTSYNPVSDGSVFGELLTMVGFEGNEHFPYQHLIRRNDNLLFVFTLEDIQQYAYELYDYTFNPYVPYEWSSMYLPALKRYESYLEFGLVPLGPDTFRVENMKAEQDGDKVKVTFDVVWFEVDDSWNYVKDTRVQPAVFEFVIMNENNHTFLRQVYSEFSD